MPGTNGYSKDPEKKKYADGTDIVTPEAEQEQVIAPQPNMVVPENYKPDIPEQPSAYDRLIEAYESRKRKDDAKERKYKAREAITGIGDAARSISNLYFTTQDAPNAFDANNSVSEKARQRTALAKAKHDKDRAEWMNYMLNIAGRKQAAEQAEANRKTTERYHDAIIAQREAAAQAAAKAKEQNEAAKKELTEIKRYLRTRKPLWQAWARDGELEQLNEEKANLKEQLDAGLISDDRYDYYMDGIDEAINTVRNQQSTQQYKEEHRTSGRGGSGTKHETFYTPFGDVSWPKEKMGKAFESNLQQVFKMLPPSYTERYRPNRPATVAQMRWAINDYLYSNADEASKRKVYSQLVTVGKQNAPTAAQQGKGTGYDNNNNGKGKGY